MIDEFEKELNGSLTRTEAELMYLVCQGKTNKDISALRDRAESSLNIDFKRIFDKLNIPKLDTKNPSERREYFIKHYCIAIKRLESLSDNFKVWPIPMSLLEIPDKQPKPENTGQQSRRRSRVSPLRLSAMVFAVIAVAILLIVLRPWAWIPQPQVTISPEPPAIAQIASHTPPMFSITTSGIPPSASEAPVMATQDSAVSAAMTREAQESTNAALTASAATLTANAPIATFTPQTPTLTLTPTETPTPTVTPTETPQPTPEPTMLFADDFDNGLKPEWEKENSNWIIQGRELTATGGVWLWITLPSETGYRVSFDMHSNSTGTVISVIAPWFKDKNYYLGFGWNAGRCEQRYPRDDGIVVYTVIDCRGVSFTGGTMTVEVSENTLRWTYGGIEITTVSRDVEKSNRLGLYLDGSSAIDNFKITALP